MAYLGDRPRDFGAVHSVAMNAVLVICWAAASRVSGIGDGRPLSPKNQGSELLPVPTMLPAQPEDAVV